MWQTDTVAAMLGKDGMKTTINSMETKGDKILDVSIAKIGSKGVFTEELEDQLSSGVTDIAVHSAKDMQSILPEGFELIAFTEREKPNDVLLSRNKSIDLSDAGKTIKIGTSSVRRVALLKHFYPHVEAVEMRGNLQTRIAKMDAGDCDALMLAYAGVKRMEYEDMIVKIFSEEEFIPPVGQGCIAIESATSIDEEKRKAVRNCLNHPQSEICLLAERAYLRVMDGGCSIPAFALARLEGDQIILRGGLASLDGKTVLVKTETGTKEQADEVGQRLADYILSNGGKEILAEIKGAQG